MITRQRTSLAAAAILLLGAGLGILFKLAPGAGGQGERTRGADVESAERPERRAQRRMATAGMPAEPSHRDEAEDRPEFFAMLVEEAQPALADMLERTLRQDDREVLNRELQKTGGDGPVSDALREQLERESAAAVAVEIEAVRSGRQTVTEAWEARAIRRKDWVERVREVVAVRP